MAKKLSPPPEFAELQLGGRLHPEWTLYFEQFQGMGFHDRGDAAAYDKDDFTTDGTWHDWDLSAIVPAGAKAVLLVVHIKDDAVASLLEFRENGNSNTFNVAIIRTQVANVDIHADLICPCDSDRVIEYYGSNLAFITTNAVVKGWWK